MASDVLVSLKQWCTACGRR